MLLPLLMQLGAFGVRRGAGRSRRASIRDGYENTLQKRRDLLDEFSRNRYVEIINSALPKEVKKEVAAIVKPFTKVKKSLPKVEQIDWKEFEQEVDAVNALFKIWQDELAILNDDDEILLIMNS